MIGNKSNFIVEIQSEEHFDKEALKAAEPVIVDFYADWCGPCKKLGPILEKNANEYKTFKLVKVNIDKLSQLADRYEGEGIPHIVLLHGGEKIMEFVGIDMNALTEMLEKTKTLSKSKPFSGTGYVLDSTSVIQNKEISAEVSNEMIKKIPAEPMEGAENSYNIVLKFNDSAYSRRFSGDDTIEVIKLYARAMMKTNQDVELFEPFPRKIYNNESVLIKSSGISKNQMLMVKMI